MDNTQFRNLLLVKSVSTPHSQNAITNSKDASATPLLGSRARSSIPMTPRSVAGHGNSNDFARQVAEHKRAALGQRPTSTKRFRSSAAPKGTKYTAGYQDRAALLRLQEGEYANGKGGHANGKGGQGHDKEERIKALEDMVKLQQIDQAMFQKLRDEIGVGGNLESTHLVKGLDWSLLEKVKRGEDITTTEEVTDAEKESTRQDIDEALEGVLENEVQAPRRDRTVKKGEMAPPLLTVSKDKMSRDEILKRLKASRATVTTEMSDVVPTAPSLGLKFRKLGSGNVSEKKKFVETVNGRKREILIVTNPDGSTKRKARWISEDSKIHVPLATVVGAAMGMEIPAEVVAKQKAMLEKQKLEEEEDDDIFAGIGANYDPLGNMSDDSDDESHTESNAETVVQAVTAPREKQTKTVEIESKPRNYFSAAAIDEAMTDKEIRPIADPNILAALKRAAAIRKAQEDVGAADDEPATEAAAHGKDFLEKLRKRESEDAGDLDLGFGESRFGDEEDEEGPIWNGREDGKKTEWKRKPKKRKSNKDG